MGRLVDIELNKKLFKNIDENSLTSTYGALENCFVTEANGLSRFPGLNDFVDIGGNSDIHIGRYENDMIAVGTDGRTFRIDREGNKTQIEGTPVLGGKRTSFARTRDGLMMTAGAQIIKYDGKKNEVLSKNAPLSTFVGFIDGYLLAVERDSGIFQHSALNNFTSWPSLNAFGVDGNPDDINSMLITPFNEILFSGEESVEQYERYVGGNVPFLRRWSTGDGISEPYTFCYADNAAWGLNTRHEFVRLSGQTTQSVSDDIQKEVENIYRLDNIGDLDNAWAAPIYIKGQKFIVVQSPNARSSYGNKGFTGVFDIRRGQWFEIFGWDDENGIPSLWPGRSVFTLWGKTFIGGQGKIYELSTDTYNNSDQKQRVYVRTAHFDTLGTMRINRIRMTIKRGVGTYENSPEIVFRTNPDQKGFGKAQKRFLGLTGDGDMIIEFGAQGTADTWQFEWYITDDCDFEIRRLQADVDRVNR